VRLGGRASPIVAPAVASVVIRGLTKRFEGTVAVDGVDLVVDGGEVRGLLGPNGAGKTTLLRMMLGLVRPDAGTVEYFGRAHSQPLDRTDVAGFVEGPTFYPYLSGLANLEVLAELDDQVPPGRIALVLEQVELGARARDRVGGYSSGMRQRLGIAAALMRAPRLLLVDEPTAGLDPQGVRFFGSLVRSLAEDGVAVLLSSHQIAEIEDVCESFTVLSRGRVVWDGSVARMRAEAPPSAYWMTTSDDVLALAIAQGRGSVQAHRSPAGGLTVSVPDGGLDSLVLALARSDVAVRRLEQPVTPLASMFFRLTDQSAADSDATGHRAALGRS
jgi:ABC-2 type transport system ATP-binding protein